MVTSESDIIELIEQDEWMMEVLATVKTLDLSDWWICSGFVRSKVWDWLHGYNERTPLPDIDVIYYDDKTNSEEVDKRIEGILIEKVPNIPWSVKNQARMHIQNQVQPYITAVDAISKFPETATALEIKLDGQNQLVLAAPHGVEDLINLHVTPTPYFNANKENLKIYKERMEKKKWTQYWPMLSLDTIKP